MGPKPADEGVEDDQFRAELVNLIDQRHELVRLAALIGWQAFADKWNPQFTSSTGRPALPTRLMAALLYWPSSEFEERPRMKYSMKSLASVLCIFLGAASCAKEAATPAGEKAAAEAVIRGLYAKKISEYESPLGKPAKAKVCAFMKSIFDSSLFAPDPTNLKCVEFGRFPNIHEEALFLIEDSGELPKTQIVESRLNGNEAVIKVKTTIISGYGTTPTRVVYFMRKTDSGWKIFNMLRYDEVWPLEMKYVPDPDLHGCQGPRSRYSFLTDPRGPEDLEDLPKVCRDFEIKERNRTKEWGQ